MEEELLVGHGAEAIDAPDGTPLGGYWARTSASKQWRLQVHLP